MKRSIRIIAQFSLLLLLATAAFAESAPSRKANSIKNQIAQINCTAIDSNLFDACSDAKQVAYDASIAAVIECKDSGKQCVDKTKHADRLLRIARFICAEEGYGDILDPHNDEREDPEPAEFLIKPSTSLEGFIPPDGCIGKSDQQLENKDADGRS